MSNLIKTLDQLNTQIDDTLGQIYMLFDQYHLSTVKAVCTTCCLTGEYLSQIEKQPLSKISALAMRDYLEAVTTENLSVQVKEIKYLLPRMLELFNLGKEIKLTEETSFDTLNLGNEGLWTSQELALIQHFALLHFHKMLITDEDPPYLFFGNTAESLILLWVRAGLDDTAFYKLWESILHPRAITAYVGLLYEIEGNRYINSLAPNKFAKRIASWALKAKVINVFKEKAKFFEHSINELSKQDWSNFEFLISYA